MRDVELTTEWGHSPQSRSCGASNHAVHEVQEGGVWVTMSTYLKLWSVMARAYSMRWGENNTSYSW